MAPTRTDARRVVIAGGGVGALEALLALHRLGEERVQVTLVCPEHVFSYRPLAVVAPFDAAARMRSLPLAEVARRHGATLQRASVSAVDPHARVVILGDGTRLDYDALLLAIGAQLVEAVPGALTYRGEQDSYRLGDVLAALRDGRIRRLAFVVPEGCGWPMPMYELALMTARWARRIGRAPQLALITAESAPLGIFGCKASDAVATELELAGVQLRTSSAVESVESGRLWMELEGSVRVDRAIALPGHRGRPPAGLAHDDHGFLPVDRWCRIADGDGVVYAVGDMTSGQIKQGGLAAQQADVAAAIIAADAGAPVEPEPYRPVLRGLLLTGQAPVYLRRPVDLGIGLPTMNHEPLWWPPNKIAGRELAPYLAVNLDLATPDGPDAVTVDVELVGVGT
jgi:sulfide:quinone oxidoreductase